MKNILCKNCNKILGTTSQERDDDLYECSACYQEKTLDYALRKGKISNHEFISEEKLEKIISSFEKECPHFEGYLGERIEKLRNNKK